MYNIVNIFDSHGVQYKWTSVIGRVKEGLHYSWITLIAVSTNRSGIQYTTGVLLGGTACIHNEGVEIGVALEATNLLTLPAEHHNASSTWT